MKHVLVYFLLVITTGCITGSKYVSTNKSDTGIIVKEIEKVQRSFNDSSKEYKIIATYKGYNPTKNIFKKLEDELKSSKRLVYQFTWQNDLPVVTGIFRAIILDVETGRKYYCFGSGYTKQLSTDSTISDKFVNDELILENYTSGKVGFIKTFHHQSSSAELGEEDYVIYEIDLYKPTAKVSIFESVIVLSEMP